MNVGTLLIKNDSCEMLFTHDTDCKLSIENHINQICTQAWTKIKAVARITLFLNKRRRELLMNAFFKSHFSYCSLSWMFLCCKLNNQIIDYTRDACV